MEMKQLSIGASLAWELAAGEAVAARQQYIEQEHLFMGVCSLGKAIRLAGDQLEPLGKKRLESEFAAVEAVFRDLKLDQTTFRRRLREKLGRGDFRHTESFVHRSAMCKKIFYRSLELAGPSFEVSCLHFLIALMEAPSDMLNGLLAEWGARPPDVLSRAATQLSSEMHAQSDLLSVHSGPNKVREVGTRSLERYGRDLTQSARDGKLGPFVGRRSELLQMIQTLGRHRKSNPMLVGEAGVGKTAIVEALAVRVADGKNADVLAGKRIIELNIGTILGGTKYRGEFEERLTHILREASGNPDIILFIDEIHNVVGAGRAEGSMDAAGLMKPALARGDLRCIGATTIGEYRRYIESDPALERRFEKIDVGEPSRDDTLEILKGLKERWEKHHSVIVTIGALEAAVDLSIRFDSDHRLPDKAIDLVDKAGARKRIPMLSVAQIGPEGTSELTKQARTSESGTEVTEMTIAQVLSEKTRVPLEVIAGHLGGSTRSRLLELATFLNKHLIGQDDAVTRVSQRLMMAHAGLISRDKPLAVFLFLGTTGVGKTEMARLLAEFLFGTASALIRIDMSEYMEEHSVAKLIGSPPGYVGHEEEGQLTGKLRTRPYSVVLLDEIEKAHPRIFDLFLQVFDGGRLTDSKGRTADARNAIFIMTSNIAVDKTNTIGFGSKGSDKAQRTVFDEVRRRFRAEFVNRIDEQIVFRSLTQEDVKRILLAMLEEITTKLYEQHAVTLRVTESAVNLLIQEGYSRDYGVRHLRRAVERLIQVPLSSLILNGKLNQHKCWQIASEGQDIEMSPLEGGE